MTPSPLSGISVSYVRDCTLATEDVTAIMEEKGEGQRGGVYGVKGTVGIVAPMTHLPKRRGGEPGVAGAAAARGPSRRRGGGAVSVCLRHAPL